MVIEEIQATWYIIVNNSQLSNWYKYIWFYMSHSWLQMVLLYTYYSATKNNTKEKWLLHNFIMKTFVLAQMKKFVDLDSWRLNILKIWFKSQNRHDNGYSLVEFHFIGLIICFVTNRGPCINYYMDTYLS